MAWTRTLIGGASSVGAASPATFTTLSLTADTAQVVLDSDGTNPVTVTIATPTAPRTLTLPNATDTLVGKATTDTMTNKTLSAPTITGLTITGTVAGGPTITAPVLTTPTIASIVNTGTLTLPTSTDTLLGRATTDTVTNKTLVYRRSAPTYGVTVSIDASLGNEFDVTATNGTAFTVANPTNATDGQRITITIRNTSGGALGVVTWDTLYKLAAWTSPATAFSRSIDFKYNGVNWVEVSRATVDVPN